MPYKNRLDPKVQEKIKKSRRDWYHRNKAHAKSEVLRRKRETSQWISDLKTSFGCSRCTEDHPACLDFHHIDPAQKDLDPGQAATSGWSKERILKEMDKCEILCSNCHRKEHSDLRGRRRLRK